MGVNFIKKYQNLVISKCGKSQNKVDVVEEIGCGNELKSLQKLATKMKWAFIKKIRNCVDIKKFEKQDKNVMKLWNLKL